MGTIVLLLFSLNLFSQNKSLDTIFCDCNKAKPLPLIAELFMVKPLHQKAPEKYEQEQNRRVKVMVLDLN